MMLFKLISDFIGLFGKAKLSEQFFMDARGLRREISDGTVEEIRWAQLKKVVIVTTDEGPYCEDLFFILEEEQGGTIVSNEWATRLALLKELEKLPYFDFEALIEAMACTDNKSFLCWQRQH